MDRGGSATECASEAHQYWRDRRERHFSRLGGRPATDASRDRGGGDRDHRGSGRSDGEGRRDTGGSVSTGSYNTGSYNTGTSNTGTPNAGGHQGLISALAAMSHPPMGRQQQPGGVARPAGPTGPANPTEREEIARVLGHSEFDSLSALEQAVKSDIAECAGAQSSASQCCGDPMSCRGQLDSDDSRAIDAAQAMINSGPGAGGLKEYCTKMKSLSDNSKNMNYGLGDICFEQGGQCQHKCESLAQEYSQRLAACAGCSMQTMLQNAVAQFQSAQATCSGLGSKLNQIADNGIGAAISQTLAGRCADVAASSSTNVADATPEREGQMDKPMNTGALDDKPDVKSVEAKEKERKPFIDTSRLDAAQGFKGYAKNKGPPTQYNVASLEKSGAAGGGKSGPPAPTQANLKNAEVQVAAKPAEGKKIETGAKGREPASQSMEPMSGSGDGFNDDGNLQKYLAKGVRSAMNRSGVSREIRSKEDNLWTRITYKMNEKCKLGVLWECN